MCGDTEPHTCASAASSRSRGGPPAMAARRSGGHLGAPIRANGRSRSMTSAGSLPVAPSSSWSSIRKSQPIQAVTASRRAWSDGGRVDPAGQFSRGGRAESRPRGRRADKPELGGPFLAREPRPAGSTGSPATGRLPVFAAGSGQPEFRSALSLIPVSARVISPEAPLYPGLSELSQVSFTNDR